MLKSALNYLFGTLLLLAICTNANAAAYCNGQTIADSFGTYYPNGRRVVDSFGLYYPNGRTVTDSFGTYYPNGARVYDSWGVYDASGARIVLPANTTRVRRHADFGSYTLIFARVEDYLVQIDFEMPLRNVISYFTYYVDERSIDNLDSICD